ncbi:MAG: UvrD-helicase domain-containing protein [Deltaproteobacteria bacterium]|jgi:uncharacterized protein (TIGR00375 family)|nr:UvrD-helicase domain-containing protein [Deltaproteobacteria bacterium]
MVFIADLHIHSRFSRATSKQLTAPLLAAWAAVKGVAVLGTGDFTHPAWRAELREALTPDETSGLYLLKDPVRAAHLLPQFASLAGHAPQPLFMLQAEISSIYKRGGQVRKVHNLVYMPDFDAAERLCRRLEQIGNLASDGRPILGLDSRHLLEMVLETDSRAALIPAHIWTPWFSLFGSKSGFDHIEDCFGDLTGEIFALETGLSSDPAMNRRWSALDRFRMVSHSDAHSGENLGRETTRFAGTPSYDGIFNALRGRPAACAYAGTLEFYPEEGKYYLDGHRACGIVLEPRESLKLKNICPACGKPLTVGVLHRVLALADRDAPARLDEPDFASIIPLPEILSELLGVGVKSRKVVERYAALLERFGPELRILHATPLAELRRYWDLFGEAIARMRDGRVIKQGGYDGEYGVIRVFDEAERRAFADSGKRRAALLEIQPSGQAGNSFTRTRRQDARAPGLLMDSSVPQGGHELPEQGLPRIVPLADGPAELSPDQVQPSLPQFSPEQRAALEAGPQAVLALAGPGAGKTRVLVGRLAHLLHQGVRASQLVALTFTRRAATELEERLRHTLGPAARLPTADTLHALAYSMWHKLSTQPPMLLSEDAALRLFRAVNPDVPARRIRKAWERFSLARERLQPCPEDIAPARGRYEDAKAELGLADYTDLLEFWLARLEEGAPRPWRHVLVDEIQDLSPLQWALIRALLPPDGQGFFGIGDPDQAIYAFRGAQPGLFAVLRSVWPELTLFRLTQSYRSVPDVLALAGAILPPHDEGAALLAVRQGPACLRLFSAPGEKAEARWIAERVRALLGSGSHSLSDQEHGVDVGHLKNACSPGEIAILVRMRALMPLYKNALEQFHIQCSVPEQEAFWHEPRVALLLAGAERFLGLGEVRASRGAEPDDFAVSPDIWLQGPAAVAAALEGQAPFDPLFRTSSALVALEKLWGATRGWKELFTQVHFMQDVEQVRERSEQVRILTLHAAKGLEFRAVFLPALEKGIVPLERSGGEEDASGLDREVAVSEELRLFYVGASRAREALFISHAAQRQVFGQHVRLEPSPFLEAIRRHCKSSALVARSRATGQQLQLL